MNGRPVKLARGFCPTTRVRNGPQNARWIGRPALLFSGYCFALIISPSWTLVTHGGRPKNARGMWPRTRVGDGAIARGFDWTGRTREIWLRPEPLPASPHTGLYFFHRPERTPLADCHNLCRPPWFSIAHWRRLPIAAIFETRTFANRLSSTTKATLKPKKWQLPPTWKTDFLNQFRIKLTRLTLEITRLRASETRHNYPFLCWRVTVVKTGDSNSRALIC